MKKAIAIMVLGLLLSGNAYAGKCIKGNCVDGYGTYEYSSGSYDKLRYEGNFLNNKFNGDGTIIDLNRDVIWQCEWRNGECLKPKVLANYTSAKTSENVIKIPLSIHILKVSEQDFTTVVDKQYVKNDVVVTNKIWKQANIVWDLKEINYLNPNLKNFKKNKQWFLNNCVGDLYACLGDKVKTPKLVSIYNKLLKVKSKRNKKTINVYYIPKMLSIKGNTFNNKGRCALHISSYKVWMKESDKYKNQGYLIIGGQTSFSSCNTSHKLAHELGHVLGLKHVTKGKYLMNGRGSEGHELSQNEVNSARNYFKKYYKILN